MKELTSNELSMVNGGFVPDIFGSLTQALQDENVVAAYTTPGVFSALIAISVGCFIATTLLYCCGRK